MRTDLIANDILLKDKIWLTADTVKIIMSRSLTRQADCIPPGFPTTRCSLLCQPNFKSGSHLNAVKFADLDELPDHLPKSQPSAKSNLVKFKKAPQLEELAQKFPEVFDGHIGRVKDEPAKIELRPDAVPSSTRAHRRIAEAYMEPLKREIETQV